ncbi:MAG: hypothetical protein IKH30_16685 [Clostridia bacterium]|nr:hypothetical protein [Clostridia bacterium]
MDTNDRQLNALQDNKNQQINLVLNTPESSDEVEIDLFRMFDTVKKSRRIYAWLLLLCIVAGICAPLLLYQISKPVQTVSSVVTLDYQVNGQPVTNITAPDGNPLDLTQILSSYVLSNALNGMKLSGPVTISSLRSNIKIERVLTDSSRRAQELAAQMKAEKNNEAFAQAQNVTLTYQNRFIVSLSNGFGKEESRTKVMLTDSELSVLLNRVIGAYNDYLAETYADMKLPADEFSVIEPDRLEVLDCLDQLRLAADNLYAYCSSKPRDIRTYRSWKTGHTLSDLMQSLETCIEVDIDYLYSYIYLNGLTRDKDTLLLNYQYRLRNTEINLETLNKNIETIDAILKNYKNDEIVVSWQENDASKTTSTPTEYFNQLVMQQVDHYKQAVLIKNRIDDLNHKIEKLSDTQERSLYAEASQEEITQNLKKAIENCREIYKQIKAHMEDLQESSQYRNYFNSTNASGKTENFLTANIKKMVIGGVAGGVVGCGIWLLSALVNEFRHHSDKKNRKEAVA